MSVPIVAREPRPAAFSESSVEARVCARSRQYLGGARLVKRPVGSRSEVHAALVGGLPWAALLHLLDTFGALGEADIAGVLGISARTLRRHRDTPSRTMPADLASRAWLLAETVARAADVFGGLDAALAWLSRPATGLDGLRPVDLLRTLQGAEIVGDFLTRLDHGVYT